MKATLQTILALLIAGVIHLQAQPEQSPAQVAWGELLASKHEPGNAGADRESAALADPEALVIRDMIVASEVVSQWDTEWLEKVTIATTEGSLAARTAAGRAAVGEIAVSSKTGPGVVVAQVMVKFWNRDLSGWSDEMIAVKPHLAANLCTWLPGATPEFKDKVWLVLKDRPAHWAKPFFKDYRSTLPKEEQIAVTQKQKDIMIALSNRDPRASAWLAEIAADLIALQLDQ